MEERIKHKKMKKNSLPLQRRSNGDVSFDDEVELNVAQILLQLQNVIAPESKSRRRQRQHQFQFSFNWSVKRKRSALNSPSSSPSPSPPSKQPLTTAAAAAVTEIETMITKSASVSTSTSPTTPFSLFSPSESDDKQQEQQLKLSSKPIEQQHEVKKREELTQCRILLKQEVETETCRRTKQKAINSELKLKTNEVICGVKIKANIETNEVMNLIVPKFKPTDTANQNHTQQQQQQQQPQKQKHYSLYNNNDQDFAMANKRRVSTTARTATGIPDLNVSVHDEMSSIEFLRFHQHFDFRANLINRAMVAAEARKKRRLIYKAKNRTLK